jgi:hypothetical protein
MRPPRPTGFTFLTACALLCACAMAWALALVGDGEGVSLPLRLALGTTGALALVTSEALAFVRPWAYRASVAFALSFIAMILVMGGGIEFTLVMAAILLMPILIALSIVWNGLQPTPVAAPGRRLPGAP